MKINISGRNFEVTEALKERIEKKLGKLSKFFKPDADAQVRMSVQRNRHILEVTIYFNGAVLRAEESGDDMYACIDKVVDILERQLGKYKTRLAKSLHKNAFKFENALKDEADKLQEEVTDFKIVKTKKFAIKPMAVEEAILQMNLLGHSFFVFSNAQTNEVNVVYKRKDGDYGLIEPEF
ncbi:MAG TPA: ribosome-associated translation inhibitor RaiA [Clostridiaceae bacterium]|jgi:putative sigma-54 modulation protein|nr:ribosome-associated translation inhibitor RaiA [Clostridiaceae bacterium]